MVHCAPGPAVQGLPSLLDPNPCHHSQVPDRGPERGTKEAPRQARPPTPTHRPCGVGPKHTVQTRSTELRGEAAELPVQLSCLWAPLGQAPAPWLAVLLVQTSVPNTGPQ